MMPKRMAWFVVGAVAGAGGSLYVKTKAKRTIERMQPTNQVMRLGIIVPSSPGGAAGEQRVRCRWRAPRS